MTPLAVVDVGGGGGGGVGSPTTSSGWPSWEADMALAAERGWDGCI